MIEKNQIDGLRNAIDEATTIALCGHASPDGDCIGSCIGLGLVLEGLGKKVSYYTATEISQYYLFLEKATSFNSDRFDPKNFDLILCLDTANQERSNMADYTISDYNCFAIDHHQGNEFSGCPVLLNTDRSSCCEIITDIIKHKDSSLITPLAATALLLGIMTDTGNFMWGYNPEYAMRIGAELLEFGADKALLTKSLYQSNKFEAIKFSGTILERTEKKEDTVIRSYHLKSEIEPLGLNSDDVSVGFFSMKSIKHEGAFILFKIEDTHEQPFMKFSFRTGSSDIDVSIIANQFGGGGHKAAAAAKVFISGDWKDVLDQVVQATHESVLQQRTSLC